MLPSKKVLIVPKLSKPNQNRSPCSPKNSQKFINSNCANIYLEHDILFRPVANTRKAGSSCVVTVNNFGIIALFYTSSALLTPQSSDR
jgi:hypothetical protein